MLEALKGNFILSRLGLRRGGLVILDQSIIDNVLVSSTELLALCVLNASRWHVAFVFKFRPHVRLILLPVFCLSCVRLLAAKAKVN